MANKNFIKLALAGVAFSALFLMADTAKIRITNTNPELRLKGYEQVLAMQKTSPQKDLKWQHLGPTNISGRCTDVAVMTPKGRQYTMLVATASAGIWKTDNEGTTWRPVFDRGPSVAMGALAIAPSDQKIVWLGTGEANIFRSSQAGCGVYKSLDGGETWTYMGLPDTYTIARIVIHPLNPNIVYVAASGHEWTDNANRGVYKTSDGGKTWQKVLYLNERSGAIDLVLDPSAPDTLYAAAWQRIRQKWSDPRNDQVYTQSGILKTTDGGKTWKAINKGLPEAKFRGRIGIDLARSNPKVIYAFVDNYEVSHMPDKNAATDSYGRPKGAVIKGATVFRSQDGGENWQQVSGLDEAQKKFMAGLSATYGWVFGQMRVDPNNENTLYVMGLEINVSEDGGKTFRSLRGIHGDQHGVWIDPANSNYLVEVNDGGIAVSYDKGKNWRSFTDNLPVCQFFNVAVDMATPFHVYGSMQDHGSFRGVVDLSRGRDKIRATAFERAPGWEGTPHAIDPNNPDMVYASIFYGALTRSDLGKKGPDSSKDIAPVVFPDEPQLRGQWLAPFILSPHNANILYHCYQYVYRSLDRGDSWERISPDLTWNDPKTIGDINYHCLFSISESPLKQGLIYVGSDDGRVHVTKDGGKNWLDISNGLPYQKWVSRIVASEYDMGTVYMTQNGKRDDDFTPYVWKSTDFGKTWVSIAANIPIGPVNVIREDPVDKNILYLGTDGAAYVSKDGGKVWNILGANLPTVYVHDLVIHPRDNIIVIATHGRGMWALDANAINEKDKKPRWNWDEDAARARE